MGRNFLPTLYLNVFFLEKSELAPFRNARNVRRETNMKSIDVSSGQNRCRERISMCTSPLPTRLKFRQNSHREKERHFFAVTSFVQIWSGRRIFFFSLSFLYLARIDLDSFWRRKTWTFIGPCVVRARASTGDKELKSNAKTRVEYDSWDASDRIT